MSGKKVEKQNAGPFFCYKNKPLVRCGEIIYYGDMSDGCIAKIRIKSTKDIDDLKISGKVSVQLIDTDPETPVPERVVRVSEKVGLYQALDVASTWLTKYTR